MKRILLATLAWLMLAAVVLAEAPNIKVAATPDGKLVLTLDHPGTWKTVRVEPIGDREVRLVWVSSDGQTGGVWTYRLTARPEDDEGPGPEPYPDPDPPPPPITQLHAVIVEERNDRTPEIANVLLSRDVRDALENRLTPIDKDILDRGDAVPESHRPWLDRAAGKPLPYLFLTDRTGATSRIVWEGQLPPTPAAMLELIGKYRPGEVQR